MKERQEGELSQVNESSTPSAWCYATRGQGSHQVTVSEMDSHLSRDESGVISASQKMSNFKFVKTRH